MRVDLRDVELVSAVVDHRSITEGARSVGLSLSAASSRITALEKNHGVSLLVRSRGGVTTTLAGDVFVMRGRQMLASAQDLLDDLHHYRNSQFGRVRLASNTSAVDALTEFLASTLSRFPDLHVALDEVPSTEVARRVRAGDADLGVVSVLQSDTGLSVHPLWADPLVIVAAPLRAQASHQSQMPTFETAVNEPMIGLSIGSPLQAFVDQQAKLLGVDIDYRLRLPTLSAVYDVARTGAGAAIIPLGTARRLGASEESVHLIPQPWAQRQAMLVVRADKQSTRVEEDFVQAMLRYRDEPRE